MSYINILCLRNTTNTGETFLKECAKWNSKTKIENVLTKYRKNQMRMNGGIETKGHKPRERAKRMARKKKKSKI